MKDLTFDQQQILSWLPKQLGSVQGVCAVVLGGSHARGQAQAGSDLDLGVLYSEASPFAIKHIRELAETVNDQAKPVVTDFYEWGPWVNGGAWLNVRGQRVDFIYRSLEHIERVIAEAEAGRYELNYAQQPPFGFFSATYLGEVAIGIPLFDPDGRLNSLKQRVATYPEALRCSVVRDFLWGAEFGLEAFARKFAARGDVYGTTACLTRAVNQLVLVLFALNRTYPLNDKTVLAEIAGFKQAPPEFGPRVQQTLAHVGEAAPELARAVESIGQLFRETVELCGGLYQPHYALK